MLVPPAPSENSSIGHDDAPNFFSALGAEFLVNTTVEDSQTHAMVAALAGGGSVVLWIDGANDDVIAQLLDGSGKKVGSEIIVNTDQGGRQYDSAVKALAGGGFVVAWTDAVGDSGEGAEGSSAVKAQLFSAAGAKIGAEILVNTAVYRSQSSPEIAELAGGNFVIVWFDQSEGDGGAGGDNQSGAVKAQLFSADGTRIGGEFLVNTTTTGLQFRAEVSPLPASGFVVAWEDYQTTDIRAQILDSAGARVGPEILVNTKTAGQQAEMRLTTLANGNILIVWEDKDPVGYSNIKAQILSPAGEKLGTEFAVPSSGRGRTVELLAMPGGGFVISWVELGIYPLESKVQLFGADGTRIGREHTISSASSEPYPPSTLALLPDGGFVAGWTQNDWSGADRSGGSVWVQRLSADGSLVGSSLMVNQATIGEQRHIYLATQSNGQLIAVWAGPDGSQAGVMGRLLTPANAEFGTAGDETLTGTDGADWLDGRGGNDTLLGRGGDDVLIGGIGDDRMEGGGGSDTYYVDSSGDIVLDPVAPGVDRIAASVSYRLHPDADIEILEAVNLGATTPLDFTGNAYGQAIVGNAGANVLRGEGGNDELVGLAGDDLLIGGTGVDMMRGGAGSDTYYVDHHQDMIDERAAPGNDRVVASVSYGLPDAADVELFEAITLSATNALDLVGNQFGQTIVGNNGANIIDGRGGMDVLVGAGGADTFRFTTALGAGNVDRIADFSSGRDKIALDDAVFTGLAPGALPAGAFVVGTQAQDADDRIIYNPANGTLWFDADGNGGGAAVQFAILSGAPTIAASDFLVI